MESFSFLKYLRGGAHRAPVAAAAAAATTIAASACEDGDDDASFFDLEFAVPGDESAASDAEEERVELSFAAGVDAPAAEAETEAVPPASLLRPATRFRVLLLKLRKPKSAPGAADADAAGASASASAAPVASRFLVKLRVEDAPPLFTRDNSSRASDAGADRPATAAEPQQQEQEVVAASIIAEERRFAKEVVLRYLSKIKPLYVKVSRRYGERLLRFGGAASEGEETDVEPDPSPSPSQAPPPSVGVVACGVRAPRASVPAGLKQVCKRLGKSRSASSAAPAALTGPQPQRRDDSLLQVQDGIQSAIAHCKRSFNACGHGPTSLSDATAVRCTNLA